jgi:hypothetical protein
VPIKSLPRCNSITATTIKTPTNQSLRKNWPCFGNEELAT